MKYKVALVQMRCEKNPEVNLAKISEAIHHAASRGAQLVCLQELHNTLYFCQEEDVKYFDLAEPIPGPTTQYLAKLSQTYRLVIVGSLFEKRAPGLYHNTAVVIDKTGEIAGMYRKMHIPDDPGFYEKFYFTPGDLGFHPIETSLGKLGVLVCWDQWYPEAARLMALEGAQLLIYPTAIGWDPRDSEEEKIRQKEAWITVQRGHAIANGCYVLAVNRVGYEQWEGVKGIQFWGNSFVAGPQGEILSIANTEETIVEAEIDLERSEQVRRIWPFFRDRRIESFSDLTKRYRDRTTP
ncbi:MAG: carbon-nitrogen hydrolase [Brevinematales bacterium]|nr:carbon-nitrogen hydrolase [Brevinematales bacterium]